MKPILSRDLYVAVLVIQVFALGMIATLIASAMFSPATAAAFGVFLSAVVVVVSCVAIYLRHRAREQSARR